MQTVKTDELKATSILKAENKKVYRIGRAKIYLGSI